MAKKIGQNQGMTSVIALIFFADQPSEPKRFSLPFPPHSS
jgi:hypothetical protein